MNKKDFVVRFSLPDTVPVGKPLPISGTLTDEDGNPVAGVTMRFWVTGSGFNKVDESNTVTDENGVWTYSGTELTPVNNGDYCLNNMWVENYDLNKYNTLSFQINSRYFQAAEGTAIESFDRLEVNADEVKQTYKCGEAFDTTGLKVRGYFTDGSGEKFNEDISDGDYTVIPRKLTGECKSITIAYSVFGQTKTATIPVTVNHDWDAGKVTKKATEQAEGIKTYTCTVCKATKTEAIPKLTPAPTPTPIPTPTPAPSPEKQYGKDGTPLGPGASFEAAEKAITNISSDKDVKGSIFAQLKLKSSKQGKTSIRLSWTKNKNAVKYVVYGNRCNAKGKTYKPKKLASVKGSSYNVKKIGKAKVKKGSYYKFMVVALDKNNKVVSFSKMIHVATKGGKAGNHKSVTVKAKVNAKGKAIKNAKPLSKVTIKKGKSVKLSVKLNPASKKQKVGKHVGTRTVK